MAVKWMQALPEDASWPFTPEPPVYTDIVNSTLGNYGDHTDGFDPIINGIVAFVAADGPQMGLDGIPIASADFDMENQIETDYYPILADAWGSMATGDTNVSNLATWIPLFYGLAGNGYVPPELPGQSNQSNPTNPPKPAQTLPPPPPPQQQPSGPPPGTPTGGAQSGFMQPTNAPPINTPLPPPTQAVTLQPPQVETTPNPGAATGTPHSTPTQSDTTVPPTQNVMYITTAQGQMVAVPIVADSHAAATGG